MNIKRAAITMALALSCGGAGNAMAVVVSSMTIEEVGGVWGGGSSVNGGTNPLNAGIFYIYTGTASIPDGHGNSGAASFDSFSTVNGITPSSPVGITNGVQQNSDAFSAGFVSFALQFRPNSCGAAALNGVCAGATTGLAATHTGAASGFSIDLSAWGGDFGSSQILQSPDTGSLAVAASAVGAAGPNRFYYSLDWRSTPAPGGPGANIADWHMEGIGTVVPLPTAAWLFGSGLLGLIGVARKKAT